MKRWNWVTAFLAAILLSSCGEGGSGSSKGHPPLPEPPLVNPPPVVPSGPMIYSGSGLRHLWIDGAAGSDSDLGTQSQPWASLEKIETVSLQPGDLVHVMPGTYTSANLRLDSIQGASWAWIGLQAEGSVTLTNNDPAASVIDISNCRYLFLKGFQITHDNGAASYGSWDAIHGITFRDQDSDNVSIDSCELHSVGGAGISAQVAQAQFITVIHCHIHDCLSGIDWGAYGDAPRLYVHYGRIANNYIHDCPPVDLDGNGCGIQVKGGSHGNVIEDNVLVNVSGNLQAAIAVPHSMSDDFPPCDPNVIRRNYVRAARNEGIRVSEGALIENNIVVDAGVFGINLRYLDTGGHGIFYGNMTVRNNTVFNVASPGGQAIYLDTGSHLNPFIIASNLFIVTGGGGRLAMKHPETFDGQADQNYTFGATSGYNLGKVDLLGLGALLSVTPGDPDFLYPAPGGVLIDNGSQGGDAQVRYHNSPDDFNGLVRLDFSDVGAYEATAPANPGWTLSDGFKPGP